MIPEAPGVITFQGKLTAEQMEQFQRRWKALWERTKAIEAIVAERARQDELWGGTAGEIASPDTTQEHRLAVLAEEFGEVAKEVLEGDPTGNLRTELIQVAAVTLAWLEVQE